MFNEPEPVFLMQEYFNLPLNFWIYWEIFYSLVFNYLNIIMFVSNKLNYTPTLKNKQTNKKITAQEQQEKLSH